jgi:polyisoprenoid-binding protein YceI
MTTAAAVTAATATAIPTGTWTVDPVHSNVEFRVKHLGIASVRGAFRKFEGTLEVGQDLASAKAYGTVEVASVDTHEPARDEHLRSADFFDATSYGQIAFESTAIAPLDEENFEISGNLSLHGVTHELTLNAEIIGTETDPQGNERVGLEITGELSRGDYAMKFNQALGSGNMLVSDKVKLLLDISAVKQA